MKFFLGIIIIYLGVYACMFFFPKEKIVTFDEGKITTLFIKQLSAHPLPDLILHEKTKQFSQDLKVVLKDYSQKKHCVILNKEQVLAGGIDITDDMITLMAEKVSHA